MRGHRLTTLGPGNWNAGLGGSLGGTAGTVKESWNSKAELFQHARGSVPDQWGRHQCYDGVNQQGAEP